MIVENCWKDLLFWFLEENEKLNLGKLGGGTCVDNWSLGVDVR